ncbi:MAG: TfoX/Sxy family protein [Rhodospirillales bacterium]|nr:TfoX/Sxy family protein [Rhodospirillales bacterium]
MAVSPSFIDFAKETFAPFGEITVKRMFGGAGVYCDGLFFAILADEAVFLKVDDATRGEFEGAGLEAFVFEMKDGSSGTMNYHNAPDALYDDTEALRHWTTLALDAALSFWEMAARARSSSITRRTTAPPTISNRFSKAARMPRNLRPILWRGAAFASPIRSA